MTNPKNKQSEKTFVKRIKTKVPDILEVKGFRGVDYNVIITCRHGTRTCKGWQALTLKHCCRKGYYESGKMWESNTLTLEQVRNRILADRLNVDVASTTLDVSGRYKKLCNVRCTIHNIFYDTNISQRKLGICPKCNKENQVKRMQAVAPMAWEKTREGVFVSKAETIWLDSIGVPVRQKWLDDIKCKVDGYDPQTNTVYLYHGGFWHGDLSKYDPDEKHPIVGLTMKELYENTKRYEQTIIDAGYNLVVMWG